MTAVASQRASSDARCTPGRCLTLCCAAPYTSTRAWASSRKMPSQWTLSTVGTDAETVGGQGWNKDLHYPRPRNRTEFGGDSMAWFEYADCMAKFSLHHYTGCHIGLRRQNMDASSPEFAGCLTAGVITRSHPMWSLQLVFSRGGVFQLQAFAIS